MRDARYEKPAGTRGCSDPVRSRHRAFAEICPDVMGALQAADKALAAAIGDLAPSATRGDARHALAEVRAALAQME